MGIFGIIGLDNVERMLLQLYPEGGTTHYISLSCVNRSSIHIIQPGKGFRVPERIISLFKWGILYYDTGVLL